MADLLRLVTGTQTQSAQKSPLKKLRKYGAVDFKGMKEDDLTAAELWLERIERVLQQLHCTPDQSVECVVSLLKEDAYQWWDTVSHAVQQDQLTWQFFLVEFRKKYVSNVYLEAKRREFNDMRQRQLTVSEYEREFVTLSRYGREIVSTKANRCKRFEEGLNDNSKLHIIALRITDFSQMVEVALNVERVRISEQNPRDRQRKRESRPRQSSMRTSISKKSKG
ncbi:uncharacterized protein LOC110652556 [Hevea brasiliensis]|uniref:uncharacterized protein LOC110652556 n=1 Tax=Hevea brasiliensis TaxID=3981 RepID=UPI0025CBF0EA|nr:uncharacterized protein LOC110652556 [Hevea brasiliensis]